MLHLRVGDGVIISEVRRLHVGTLHVSTLEGYTLPFATERRLGTGPDLVCSMTKRRNNWDVEMRSANEAEGVNWANGGMGGSLS